LEQQVLGPIPLVRAEELKKKKIWQHLCLLQQVFEISAQPPSKKTKKKKKKKKEKEKNPLKKTSPPQKKKTKKRIAIEKKKRSPTSFYKRKEKFTLQSSPFFSSKDETKLPPKRDFFQG
jgi:hypothetical protein